MIKEKTSSLHVRFSSMGGFQKSLIMGFLAGGVLFGLIFLWLQISAPKIALKLQSNIPTKFVKIETPDEKKPESLKQGDEETPVQEGLIDTPKIIALPAAPIEGLSENADGKSLPIVRFADDMSPFEAYKKPFEMVAGRPVISIVLVDFGIAETLSQEILDTLPPEISLVLNPYAKEPSKWAAAARGFGHEFWIQMPMQTKEFGLDDTGPLSILMNAPIVENEKRLFAVMGNAVGYAGLVSQKDHIFTAENVEVGPIAQQIFGRGLAFAESNPNIPPYAQKLAKENGHPYAQNNLWLDQTLRPADIDLAFQTLEKQAAQSGKAVAFAHPYPIVLKKLTEWIKSAEGKGIQIAPLSATVE